MIYLEMLIQLDVALRLRGGSPDANNDSKHNEIPYLSNMRFMWSGLPSIDFQDLVMNPLNNGLGSMNIKGGTLLQTANNNDPGGVLGNPPRAAAPAPIIEESIQRNFRRRGNHLNHFTHHRAPQRSLMLDPSTKSSNLANNRL